MTGDFADIAITLYVAHHVGDYWIQRDQDAQHKGDPGWDGRLHCLSHVVTYVATQTAMLLVMEMVLRLHHSPLGSTVGLAVSGVTHYIADRREPLKRIASWIPGRARFIELGTPRSGVRIEAWDTCPSCGGDGNSSDEASHYKCWDCRAGGKLPYDIGDNPQLATGLWALDQSWHIFWSVFVAALLMVTL